MHFGLFIFVFLSGFGILGPPYYGIGATIRIGRDMLCLPYAGFLDMQNPWGKKMEKVVSELKTFAHKWFTIIAQKKVCFLANFALEAGLFWYRWY